MSAGHLSAHNQSLVADVQAVVVRLVRQQGVPVTVDQASKFAERLYPSVVRARESAYRAHMVELGRQAVAAGVELRAEPLEEYPPKALFDAVCQIARITPGSTNIRVDVLDKETGELVSTPVMPSADNRHDRVVEDRVAAELSRRVSRHVVQAGRQAVASTVHNGSARFAGSARPAHAGYARVLTGRENCAFCTMLASRGPVYREDTVVKRKDGRRYHDGCDCVPVLVVKGHPWEGEDAYRRLEKRWRDVTWRKDSSGEPIGPGPGQWVKWRAHVEGGKLNAKDFTPTSKARNWPKISSFEVPSLKNGGNSTAFPGESVPADVHRIVGHVLYGWRDRPLSGVGTIPHTENQRYGHTWDSKRTGASKFPREWSHQQIAAAVLRTLEDPDYVQTKQHSRIVWREVDGILVMAKYALVGGEARFVTSHPVDRISSKAKKV